MHNMKYLWAICVLLFLIPAARGDTLWTYQGNSVGYVPPLSGGLAPVPPNPCACALSGTVDVTTGAYSFTDGTQTLTNTNSVGTVHLGDRFSNLFTAQTHYWDINIFSPTLDWNIWSQNYGSPYEQTDHSSGFLYVQGNEGTWTETVTTPEPGTLTLLGLGLMGLLSHRRKSGIST